MANTNAKIDENYEKVSLAVNDTTGDTERLLVDPSTSRLLITIDANGGGGGTLNTGKIDENYEKTSLAITDDGNTTPTPFHIHSTSGFLNLDLLVE